MSFQFGAKSLLNLQGCHPVLRDVATAAIGESADDFGIYEGLRSAERQREYLRRGVTKTLKSKHLKQADGFSHAFDAVPWIAGSFRWEWEPLYQIASAIDRVATRLGVASRIRWGGVWDRTLADYGTGTDVSMRQAVQAYTQRHPGPDFIDGPQFELVA
jgi:peptidoglycan L-alanyl-D-glutamate endopeptidase CwlK